MDRLDGKGSPGHRRRVWHRPGDGPRVRPRRRYGNHRGATR